MGLDLTIYKTDRKGRKKYLNHFSSDGWIIVTYLEQRHKKSLNDQKIVVSEEEIKDLIGRCKKVLLYYYERIFEEPNKWVENAHSILPITINAKTEWYDDEYIDNLSYLYRDLWKIVEELYDYENIIFEISY